MSPELPTIAFASQAEWEAWLEQNHGRADGLWLKLAKAATGIETVTYAEAVESALCFGWIDGQKASLDDHYWLQKFTPRRPRSRWSRINREKAEALIATGRMRTAGLAEVERAKADGRWDSAYESPSRMKVPDDLRAALAREPKAKAAFEGLDSRNRYAILFRIHDAKRPETRARRIEGFVAQLARGDRPLP
jgi:uncharacterized protein YdeI (YjbR/CyaY-like superfamily)